MDTVQNFLFELESSKWYQKALMSLLNLLMQTPVLDKYLKLEQIDADVINVIWNYFQLCGIAIVLIAFCVELSKLSLDMHGEMSALQAFSPILKMLAGVAFICAGKDIVSYVLGFNNAVVDWISSRTLFNANDLGSTTGGAEWISELGLLECLILFLPLLIIAFISLLIRLVIFYQAASRRIEFDIRAGLTPIAIGDIFKGMDSTAVRYLKKLIALGLWGFAMVAIMQIGCGLQVSMLSDITSNLGSGGIEGVADAISSIIPALINMIIYPLAEAGMISASKQICFDVLGC